MYFPAVHAASTSPGPNPRPRLLIIGWDAADWTFLDPMLERGELPALGALLRRGLRSGLATLEPALSPMLWTSVATGKTADKHRILNFIEPDPAGTGFRLSSSTSRRTKALWNILTQRGLAVNTVGWYASHPAEPIGGLCVSNVFATGRPSADGSWPMPAGCVHPPPDGAFLAGMRVDPSSLGADELASFVPQARACSGEGELRLLRSLAGHVAQARSTHAASLHAVRRAPWDCTLVFHDMIDALGHHFMSFVPPRMKHVSMRDFSLFGGVMAAAYREQDRMLGELLEAAGDGVSVILLSDHGFHNGPLRPVMHGPAMSDERLAAEAAWHAPIGVLAMAGPGIRPGAVPVAPGLLDIAPTALAILGLPRGEDMDGRILQGVLEAAAPPAIPSWDDEPGEAALHPPDIRQDPYEAFQAIQQLVDLGYMQALPQEHADRVEFVGVESDVNLATVYRTTGRPERAIPVLERVLGTKHASVRHALGLADALHRCGRHADGAALARRWLDRDDADQSVRLALAISLTFMGRHEDAARETDRLAARDADGCAGLGDLCIMQGRADAAERRYRAALACDGRHVRSHVGLAQVALLRDRLEACANHCLDAAQIDPRAGAAHYLLGVALAWHGSLDDAERSFRLAATLMPSSPSVHEYLALVLAQGRDRSTVAEHTGRAGACPQDQRDPLAFMPRPPAEWRRVLSSCSGSY